MVHFGQSPHSLSNRYGHLKKSPGGTTGEGVFLGLISFEKFLIMENHIKLISGFNSNSYIRQFQVAQLNLYLFSEEEKLNKKRYRLKHASSKVHGSR